VAYFPQFMTSKAMVQLDSYKSQTSFRTIVVDIESGPRQTYGLYGTGLNNFPTDGLGKYQATVVITDAELVALRDFFEDRNGRLEEFIFLDPSGNLVKYSEDFANVDWTKTNLSLGALTTDPYNGSLAYPITATTSDGFMSAPVLPAGDASGFVLTASAWVKPQSPGQTLEIGFTDGGGSVLGSRTWQITTVGRWYRIHYTHTLASAAAVRMKLGGFSTWNATTIHVFGVQVVALPAEGGYVKSPACYGYRPKCRFDMDEFKWRKTGPDENTVSFSIEEVF
jgi:hypothetical protein